MKSYDDSFLRDEDVYDAQIGDCIASQGGRLRTPKTRREFRVSIRAFLLWWQRSGRPVLTQQALMGWMLDGVRRAKVKTVSSRVVALDHFMAFLVEKKLLGAHPLRELREGYRNRGYRGILQALQRTDSVAAVVALADRPFSGPLGADCVAYLDFLAALGKRCANHRYHLLNFERFVRQRGVNAWKQIDRSLIHEWLQTGKPASGYQRRCWLLVLEDLFRFLIHRGLVAHSPVPSPGPHLRHSLSPRILSREEIASILEQASKMPEHRLMPFRGPTYRMLFLTLYTLGLRIQEALNLRLSDIDFVQHSITIGTSKFYKGRVLPMGPKLEAALRRHIEEHPLLRHRSRDAFLFPTDSHRTPCLARDSALRVLRRIVCDLGITTPPETRRPCLHSFRHSFAVHRAEQWLREGANLEAKLPLLSAFLGHVDAAATQVYLAMTPARLQFIGDRFEAAVGKGEV